ncbi:hypothetical protein BH09MYX1_BH09MYX1_63770 [soil metagenome]
MPGSVEVTLTTGSGEPLKQTANVTAGQTVDVTLDVAGDGAPLPPIAPPTPASGGMPPWRPLWITG